MLRTLSILMMFTLTIMLLCAFFMAAPANVSVTPGIEGPPPPPKLTIESKPPRVYCHSAILIDNKTSQELYGKKEYEVRPIASITKLLTVLTFLDFDVDWQKEVRMLREDARNSSKSRFRSGDVFHVQDLFYGTMIASDNRAARALARSTEVPRDSFVVLMNLKARDLGLLTLHVEEVTGLSEKNVASAADCACLLNIAAGNQTIKQAMRTRTYEFTSVKYKRRHRLVNTNRLLKSRWYVEGGKTGYIFESGWCLAVRCSDWHGIDLTAVVLGARSQSARFSQAAKLFKWGFKEMRELQG